MVANSICSLPVVPPSGTSSASNAKERAGTIAVMRRRSNRWRLCGFAEMERIKPRIDAASTTPCITRQRRAALVAVDEDDATHVLHELSQSYDHTFEHKKGALSPKNRYFWGQRTMASES